MTPDQRNYGLDVYRLLAMVMVTSLHVICQHYGLTGNRDNTCSWIIWNVIHIFCFCAVDCFALLTGFLSVDKRLSTSGRPYDSRWFKKFVSFWITASLFGIVICVMSLPRADFHAAVKTAIHMLCPLTVGGGWWYVSAYLGMLLLLPLVQNGITNLSRRSLLVLVSVLLLGFSVIPTFMHSEGALAIEDGYSTLWLLVMFLVGVALRENWETILNFKHLNAFLTLGLALSLLPQYILFFGCSYLNIKGTTFLTSYISPCCVLQAICLLILCSKIRVHCERIQLILAFCSKHALGIYLLQCHPVLWLTFFSNAKKHGLISFSESLWRVSTLILAFVLAGIVTYYVILMIQRYLGVNRLVSWVFEKYGTYSERVAFARSNTESQRH